MNVYIEREFGYFLTRSIPLLFVLSFQFAFSQTIISGKIVNENNEPLPLVHLRIENTNIGTISNDLGLFTLVSSAANKNVSVVVSTIGFTTKTVDLSEGYHTIKLSQNVTELSEVVLNATDSSKELIQKAINAIPNNYPSEDELHFGFFRESTKWENDESPIYIVEAVIESNKKPFTKTSRSGDVKLVEFRKYESDKLDSLNTRIYAGSHHIHRFDFVHRKEAFLSSINGYKYLIVDTLQLHNNDVYKVSFNRKNKISGYVYIQDDNYAIIKVEFKQYSFFDLINRNRQFLNYTVSYEQGDDKVWRFKHSHYNTAFKRKGRLFYLESEYVTTEVKSKSADIPYLERLHFDDIILDESKEYKSTFWNDYNIILPDKYSEDLFKNIDYAKYEDGKNKLNTLLALLSKFKYELGIYQTSIGLNYSNFSYTNSSLNILQNRMASKKTSWGFTSSFLYQLRPNLYIGIATKSKILKTGLTSNDLLVSGEFNINPKGRPVTISPRIHIGYQTLDFFIDDYRVEEDIIIDGKTFNSDEIAVSFSQKGFHLKPNLSLIVEKSKKIGYYISVGYNYQLNNKEGLFFEEREGFPLFRKKSFLENNNENLSIKRSQNELFKNNLIVGLGITFKL